MLFEYGIFRAGWTGIEHLAELVEAGYDYAELPLAQMMALDEQKFYETFCVLRHNDIHCEVCNNFFPGSMRLTGPCADKTEDLLKCASRAFDRASALGTKKVRIQQR